MAYHWLAKAPIVSIISIADLSSGTVIFLCAYFRLHISGAVNEEDIMIERDKVVIEINESKLGKRKYYRNHHVEEI